MAHHWMLNHFPLMHQNKETCMSDDGIRTVFDGDIEAVESGLLLTQALNSI